MPEIVTKVHSAEAGTSGDETPGGFSQKQSRELRVSLEGGPLERMRKQVVVGLESPPGSRFSIVCDEGADLAGDDTAPPPLAYFSAAIAF